MRGSAAGTPPYRLPGTKRLCRLYTELRPGSGPQQPAARRVVVEIQTDHTMTDSLPFTVSGVLQHLRQLVESRVGQSIPPGIWLGSATDLANLTRRSPSPRRLREAMAHLEQHGDLRTWRRPGQRGRYPILLHGHLVQDAHARSFRTDAGASSDWRAPVLHALPAQPAGLSFEAVPEQVWTLYCRERGNLAAPPPLTPERRSQYLRAALDYPGGAAAFLLDFGGALRLARRSRFLLGANRSGRPFGLDWLLREPENLRKTLSGRYNDAHPVPEEPAPPLQFDLPWPEPAHPTLPLPLTDAARAEAEWTQVQHALRQRMNPKSFSTWIRTLRAAGYDQGTLVLFAPTADFLRVPERFSEDLPPDCPPIRVVTAE